MKAAKEGARSYIRPKRTNQWELREMEIILKQCGYNPAAAVLLQREGMGPEELRDRLRFAPGEPGSLEWTHGYKKENPLSSGAGIAIGLAVAGGAAALAYYLTRPATAAAIVPVPSLPPSSGGGTPSVPPMSSGGGPTPSVPPPKTYQATDVDSGAQFNLNKGDTLAVVLPVSITSASYTVATATANPPVITVAGPIRYSGAQALQNWTATNSGSQQITYQAQDGTGAPSGLLLSFNVIVA